MVQNKNAEKGRKKTARVPDRLRIADFLGSASETLIHVSKSDVGMYPYVHTWGKRLCLSNSA
jgi:hypothetical protein